LTFNTYQQRNKLRAIELRRGPSLTLKDATDLIKLVYGIGEHSLLMLRMVSSDGQLQNNLP